MLKTISKVRRKHLKSTGDELLLCLLNFLNSGRNLFFRVPMGICICNGVIADNCSYLLENGKQNCTILKVILVQGFCPLNWLSLLSWNENNIACTCCSSAAFSSAYWFRRTASSNWAILLCKTRKIRFLKMTRNPTKRRIYDFSRGEGCLVLCGCKIELKPVTPMQYCTVSTLTFTTVFNYILFNSPTEVKRGAASHPIHPLPKSDPATPTDSQKKHEKRNTQTCSGWLQFSLSANCKQKRMFQKQMPNLAQHRIWMKTLLHFTHQVFALLLGLFVASFQLVVFLGRTIKQWNQTTFKICVSLSLTFDTAS